MTMKILIVEDNPSLVRMYKEIFSRMMPEARVDIVVSVGGYLKVSETRYDAYIMDEEIEENKSAFSGIVPIIQKRFPDTFVLHNSSETDPEYISRQERINKIRFARGPDGNVITCNKQLTVILEFLKTMVVCKEDIRQKPTFERMPACQSMRSHTEPRKGLSCCRP
ncbi:MAG: hypothetical protein NTY83_04190 [Candidatus Micrarchaeota archaeon]|nr:hypothetical protein [Candidatus Micrarchaeota archaeon]